MPLAARTRKRLRAKSVGRVSLRDVIRNTARDLFARQGYESVSMRRIGAEVGCSPMAMYRHFASKEDLLLSICEETFEQMNRALDLVADKPGTRLEVLRASINSIIDFHLSHPNHFRVTFMTPMPSGPASERRAAVARRTVDRLRKGVRESAEARGLNVDVETITQMIRVGIYGYVSILITLHKLCPLGDPEPVRRELIATLTRQLE
jgi:AcrR family transcriptional regulator